MSEAHSVTAIEGLDSSSARESTGRVLSRAHKSSVRSLALEEGKQETIKKKVMSSPPGHLACILVYTMVLFTEVKTQA